MDDRLKKFIAVVEYGGFNKAARATHISQPALSMAIRQLEQELEVSLFIRNGRSNELTEAGQTVYQTAISLRLQTTQLQQDLAPLKDSKPLLRIGMIDSIADLLFVRHNILQDIAHKADVSLTVDGSRRLTDAIATGTLDIAYIVTPQPALPPTINSQEIGNETLVAVCAPKFKNNHLKGSLPFIAYNEHASSRPIIDNALKSQGITTQIIMRSTSPEVMLKLCLSGVGFTVLPEQSVQQYLSSGQLTKLNTPNETTLKRPLLAITHKSTALHPVAKQILQLTTNYLK